MAGCNNLVGLHPFIFDLQTTGHGAGKRDLPEHAELALGNLHENN